MRPLSGKISDKLRSLFTPNASEWNPPRPAAPAPTKDTKPPKGVKGHRLGGRHQR